MNVDAEMAIYSDAGSNPAISILSSNHVAYNVISVAISGFFKITLIRKGNSFQKNVTFFCYLFYQNISMAGRYWLYALFYLKTSLIINLISGAFLVPITVIVLVFINIIAMNHIIKRYNPFPSVRIKRNCDSFKHSQRINIVSFKPH